MYTIESAKKLLGSDKVHIELKLVKKTELSGLKACGARDYLLKYAGFTMTDEESFCSQVKVFEEKKAAELKAKKEAELKEKKEAAEKAKKETDKNSKKPFKKPFNKDQKKPFAKKKTNKKATA